MSLHDFDNDFDADDHGIELLIRSIQNDVTPKKSLRANLIDGVKQSWSDLEAERKLSGFAITLTLMLLFNSKVVSITEHWGESLKRQSSQQIHELTIEFAEGGLEAADWSIHAGFDLFRKKQVASFSILDAKSAVRSDFNRPPLAAD